MEQIINAAAAKIAGVVQNNPHHCYCVLCHTKAVVKYLEKHGASRELVIAGWLHDVGKAMTKARHPETGHDIFHGHAKESMAWAESQFPELSEDILAWIKYHDMQFQHKKTVAKYVRKYGYRWVEALLLLREADIMAQSEYQKAEKLATLQQAREWLEELKHQL